MKYRGRYLQRIIPHAWHGSFNPYIYQLKQHFNWWNFSWLNFQLEGKQRRNTKVKNDHRSSFSNLSNWKDEAWKSLASMGGAPHGKYELNKLTSLPLCGFIAQFVEHCTGIAKVTGLNPVEALIFFRLLPSNTSQRRNTLFQLMNTLVQFCGEHAGSNSCRFYVLDTVLFCYISNSFPQYSN